MKKDLVLYILVRNDLKSLNPGKMAAQVSHAANQFAYEVSTGEWNTHDRIDLKDWQGERGFGKCIVLDAAINEIIILIDKTISHNIVSGITHDHSYPVKDGKVTHLIPLDTCAFIFGEKDMLVPYVGCLKLRK
jgi:peptidyl-tRNA hydrolase